MLLYTINQMKNLLHYLNEKGVPTKIDAEQLQKAQLLLSELF